MRNPSSRLGSVCIAICFLFAACTEDGPAKDALQPTPEADGSGGAGDPSTDRAALSIELVQITSCDADGNRRVFLNSSLSPPNSDVDVRWLHNDATAGTVTPVGPYSLSVVGDGDVHTFEVAAAPQTAAAGAVREVEVPRCEASLVADGEVVLGEIVSIEVGECDGAGFRELLLAGSVSPAGSEATVQWVVDGQALGAPGLPGSATTQVAGAGQVLAVELRVLSPGDGLRATREVEVPPCADGAVAGDRTGATVAGRIVSVDIGECDGAGFRELSLVGDVDPAGAQATGQWVLDGQALAAPGPVGPASAQILGDGQIHLVELRLLSPQGGVGGTRQVDVPACGGSTGVAGEIESLEVGNCSESGFREVTFSGGVRPVGSDATVQWIVDGRALAAPGPVGSAATPVFGDGQVHVLELRVLVPNDGVDARQEFEVPDCGG